MDVKSKRFVVVRLCFFHTEFQASFSIVRESLPVLFLGLRNLAVLSIFYIISVFLIVYRYGKENVC